MSLNLKLYIIEPSRYDFKHGMYANDILEIPGELSAYLTENFRYQSMPFNMDLNVYIADIDKEVPILQDEDPYGCTFQACSTVDFNDIPIEIFTQQTQNIIRMIANREPVATVIMYWY